MLRYYPNKFIQRDDMKRFHILNTLFNLTGEGGLPLSSPPRPCPFAPSWGVPPTLCPLSQPPPPPQKPTSMPASWTSSPTAPDTSSKEWVEGAGTWIWGGGV